MNADEALEQHNKTVLKISNNPYLYIREVHTYFIVWKDRITGKQVLKYYFPEKFKDSI